MKHHIQAKDTLRFHLFWFFFPQPCVFFVFFCCFSVAGPPPPIIPCWLPSLHPANKESVCDPLRGHTSFYFWLDVAEPTWRITSFTYQLMLHGLFASGTGLVESARNEHSRG